MQDNEYRHLPSGGTVVGCIVTMAIALMFLFIFSSSKQTNVEQNRMTIVPKTGTIEYEEYTKQFAEEYGREWDTKDQMIAIKNGVHVQIGLLGYLFSITIIYFHIYNWYWWFKDRKAYIDGETNEQPQSLKTQLVGTAIVVFVVIIFGGYLWLIAPHMVESFV